MTEVLKALQQLNVCWKKIGHYNMKCRWISGFPGHHEGMVNNQVHNNHYFGEESTIIENEIKSPSVIKFEVQVTQIWSILLFSIMVVYKNFYTEKWMFKIDHSSI